MGAPTRQKGDRHRYRVRSTSHLSRWAGRGVSGSWRRATPGCCSGLSSSTPRSPPHLRYLSSRTYPYLRPHMCLPSCLHSPPRRANPCPPPHADARPPYTAVIPYAHKPYTAPCPQPPALGTPRSPPHRAGPSSCVGSTSGLGASACSRPSAPSTPRCACTAPAACRRPRTCSLPSWLQEV